MIYYKVVWIFQGEANEPKEMIRTEDNGFDAECGFLKWAGVSLDKPVKVLRVEEVKI